MYGGGVLECYYLFWCQCGFDGGDVIVQWCVEFGYGDFEDIFWSSFDFVGEGQCGGIEVMYVDVVWMEELCVFEMVVFEVFQVVVYVVFVGKECLLLEYFVVVQDLVFVLQVVWQFVDLQFWFVVVGVQFGMCQVQVVVVFYQVVGEFVVQGVVELVRLVVIVDQVEFDQFWFFVGVFGEGWQWEVCVGLYDDVVVVFVELFRLCVDLVCWWFVVFQVLFEDVYGVGQCGFVVLVVLVYVVVCCGVVQVGQVGVVDQVMGWVVMIQWWQYFFFFQ